MIVLGKQINIKSIARVLIITLGSAWFIPVSCTSILFGVWGEDAFYSQRSFPSDNFDNKDFTIVAVSDAGADKDFIAMPYSDIKTNHSLTFLMSESKGQKIGKPFKFGTDGDDIYPSISYEVIEQGAQRQIIEVVKWVDIPHLTTKYESRYKVINSSITPISFKRYGESMSAYVVALIPSLLVAIFICSIFKLLLYRLFTKSEKANGNSNSHV